jgi:transposase-like protein
MSNATSTASEGGESEVLPAAVPAKGLTTGEIQAHLAEIYDTEVSRETISKITDAVLPDMVAWQSRPLECGRFLVVVANQLCGEV